ncbi:MAG: C4-type zinc ribbon domain-containing protein [Elusimicrobiota bacterium]|nr:C4-type zinc ribbon domain-containing protein [Endomicrobiia bacterium]MDW8166313.1 C4-type zinc ribbon domain-containing protein [Elusimicrobiota bacterium]
MSEELILTLKKLLKLQSYDEELILLKEEIEAIPIEIQNQESLISQIQKAKDELKEKIKKTQVEIKEKEIEIQSIEQQIKKHTQELNSVKTNEQYRALLNEIERLNQQKDTIETEILILMEELDKKNKELKEEEDRLNNTKNLVEQKIRELKEKHQKLKENFELKNKERNLFASTIDKKYLDIYNNISSKKESALSAVNFSDNTCEKCNMSITKQEINEIRKYEEFIFCSSCSRILYISEDLKDTQQTTKEGIALPKV